MKKIIVILFFVLFIASCTAQENITDVDPIEDNTISQGSDGLECPFGRIDDPYPGYCRLYTDQNSDGICDYSQ